MSLLAAVLYDPATAVAKALAATNLVMTAVDTTNLRITFTAPASGNVLVVMQCAISGATIWPQPLLGVMQSSTIIARVAPVGVAGNAAGFATARMLCDATFEVTGLTPGNSYTWDAAYGSEVVVTSSAIRYGGPNDAAGSDAWGAFRYAIYAV